MIHGGSKLQNQENVRQDWTFVKQFGDLSINEKDGASALSDQWK